MADTSWLDAHPVVDMTGAPVNTAPGSDVDIPKPAPVNNTDWLAAHPVVQDVTPKPEQSFLSNLGTAFARMPAGVAATPHTLADLYMGLSGDRSGIAPWVAKNSPSIDQATDIVFRDVNSLLGTNYKPYVPQTGLGKVFQEAVSTAPIAAIGGGGLMGLASREAANASGIAGQELAANYAPNHPALQAGAGLLGALVGGEVPNLVRGGAAMTGNFAGLTPTSSLNNRVAGGIVDASKTTPTDLISSIDQNRASWEFPNQSLQPMPTLGDITGNTGVRNMVYNDQAAAKRAQDSIYQENAQVTNAAQRQAVANATPDLSQDIARETATRDAGVGGFGTGLTAQNAGSQFRQNLQDVYDQRLANRAAGGTMFDALENSPATVQLTAVKDYAMQKAASNAGEVGAAYQAALNQFKTPTGISLETPAFAASVLHGLGDLASSYPRGSAAQRAVLDVKSEAENAINTQVPDLAAARATYAQNSRPLDVFEQQPFSSVLEKDQFGRDYTNAADAVVPKFLSGTGSADALDKLHSIFPDPEAATSALQDFLATRVRNEAVEADGSINLSKMQAILKPYQGALMRFPTLNGQFSTARNAQQALDQLSARQELFDKFKTGLGTSEKDAQGSAMYAPAAFNKEVQNSQALITQAYGPQNANIIKQVDDQLSSIAQTAQARVKGQSGTSQSMVKQVLGGSTTGTILGVMIGHLGFGEHMMSGLGGAALGAAIPIMRGRMEAQIEQIRRQALTDPAFARALLVKYNDKMPSPAGNRAMTFVQQRLSGVVAPTIGVDVGPPQ